MYHTHTHTQLGSKVGPNLFTGGALSWALRCWTFATSRTVGADLSAGEAGFGMGTHTSNGDCAWRVGETRIRALENTQDARYDICLFSHAVNAEHRVTTADCDTHDFKQECLSAWRRATRMQCWRANLAEWPNVKPSALACNFNTFQFCPYLLKREQVSGEKVRPDRVGWWWGCHAVQSTPFPLQMVSQLRLFLGLNFSSYPKW